MPPSSELHALLGDGRWYAALAVAALAGLVRGFSAFGSALIYMPLMSALYEPRVAAATLLIIDGLSGSPFALRAFPQSDRKDLLPIVTAAAVATPFGVLVLRYADPVLLRWVISALVVGLLAALVSGWRYSRQPGTPTRIGVGLFVGFFGGAVMTGGPAAIFYWLAGPHDAARARANLMVFFGCMGILFLVNFLWQGLLSLDLFLFSMILGPAFFGAMAIGAWMFRGSSEILYRRVAYLITALAAIVSLPLFDAWLR